MRNSLALLALLVLAMVPATAQTLEETWAMLNQNNPATLKRSYLALENEYGAEFRVLDPRFCIVQRSTKKDPSNPMNEFIANRQVYYFNRVIVAAIRKETRG
jgi:hypothetical protein